MSKLKLTLNNEGDSFRDKFYLLESGTMYCIYLKDSHAVLISQPTLHQALDSLSKLLHNYGSFTKLMTNIRGCEYPLLKVAPAVLVQRQKEYKENGTKYEDLVEEVIDKFNNYTEEVLKEKTKVKPVFIKKKKIIKRRA